MEPYFNHPKKEITEIDHCLTEIMAPYRFPMGLGIGASTLRVALTNLVYPTYVGAILPTCCRQLSTLQFTFTCKWWFVAMIHMIR